MRRQEPLAKLLACALTLSLTVDAFGAGPERALTAPTPGKAVTAPKIQLGPSPISGTFGAHWDYRMTPAGEAVSRIAAQAPDSGAASSQNASYPLDGAPVPAGDAVSPASDDSAAPGAGIARASERIPQALERARAALLPPSDPAANDAVFKQAQLPDPLVKLVRPAANAFASSMSSLVIPEAASKRVSALRNLLLTDRAAAVAEAEKRLFDDSDKRVEIRSHAARLVIEHAGPEGTSILTRALAAEKNWYVQRELAFGLGLRADTSEPHREPALDGLRAALAHENDSLHLMAHWAMTQLGADPGAERPLKVIEVDKTPRLTRRQKVMRGVKSAVQKTAIAGAVVGVIGGIIALGAVHGPKDVNASYAYSEMGGWGGEMFYQAPAAVVADATVVAAAKPDAATALAPRVEAPVVEQKAQPAPTDLLGHIKELTAQTKRVADAATAQAMLTKQALEAQSSSGGIWSFLLTMIVTGAMLMGGMAMWNWIMARKRDKKGGDKPRGGGSSGPGTEFMQAKTKGHSESDTRFSDLAGIEGPMRDMVEVVDFLRDPAKFKALGGKMPKGFLLVGPPGTGKTALAQALANEAGVPFFSVAGSDFVEMFVGVGASRVRDLFAKAKAAGKAIVFIDEIDAVGKTRAAGPGGNDEREQTLNQMLIELDGFAKSEGIILIAATNRADTLDPALLRPGRFNRQIQVTPADVIGREAILEKHARQVPLAPDVDLKLVAERAPGMSGAFLMNFVNEAALNAARHGRRAVTDKDFDVGLTRTIIGDENPILLDDGEKLVVSYHESGHVFTGRRLNKVTIIPHGPALGYAEPAEEIEKRIHSQDDLMNELVILMGGRAAEKIKFGKFWNGADNDLERATAIARNMVERWGMSEAVGYAQTGPDKQHPYAPSRVSEATKAQVDAEVKRLIHEAHEKATKILTERWSGLEAMAQELVKHETLHKQDIERLTEAGRAKP